MQKSNTKHVKSELASVVREIGVVGIKGAHVGQFTELDKKRMDKLLKRYRELCFALGISA